MMFTIPRSSSDGSTCVGPIESTLLFYHEDDNWIAHLFVQPKDTLWKFGKVVDQVEGAPTIGRLIEQVYLMNLFNTLKNVSRAACVHLRIN